MKKIFLALLILLGVTSVANSTIHVVNVSSTERFTVFMDSVATGGLDTILFKFATAPVNFSAELWFDTLTTNGGTDSALALGKPFAVNDLHGEIAGRNYRWRVEDLKSQSSVDTCFWESAGTDSVAYIDYANNGISAFSMDEGTVFTLFNSILYIVKDGNRAGNGGFKYALVIRLTY